jgi:hypothetical protein
MQNLLKFIASVNVPEDLFIIDNAVKKRFAELEALLDTRIKENEQCEREQLWKLWRERAIEMIEEEGIEKRAAIYGAFGRLHNVWIERNGESDCGNCGKREDYYYESVFCKSIAVCDECTECVDMSHLYDEMSDEIRECKRNKSID